MTPSPVHLLVLVHGMWGHPGHLSEMARIIRETKDKPSEDGIELKVLLAETNREESTYDGIDWGGERVAEEVTNEVSKLAGEGKKVVKFSVAGYSLGGLISRYLIGILYQRGFFNDVVPVNFNTVATPHIGLPRYRSFWSSLTNSLGPTLLSRTGEQFYCVDKWSSTGRPLILVMADPDRVFYKALALFQNKTIYGNAINDITVPYVTACIEPEDPFALYLTNGIEVKIMDGYSPLIESWSLPADPPAPLPKPRILTRNWFRSFKSKDDRPIVPPFLQFRFPFNIVLYLSLPLLVPIAMSFAIIRFCIQSSHSRRRVKLLEKEDSQNRLVHIFARLEREMEETVADLIDDPGASPADSETDVTSIPRAQARIQQQREAESSTKNSASKGAMTTTATTKKEKHPVEQPILTPMHYQMIEWMNRLPGLKKERAFIAKTRNSHATAVCRDVKRFPIHRAGEGVLRHLADHFEL